MSKIHERPGVSSPNSSKESLSPTEWLLMRSVWAQGSATNAEVAEWLTRDQGRPFPTHNVGPILTRLAKRGFLTCSPLPQKGPGRPELLFTPTIPYAPALQEVLQWFLKVYVGNERTALVSLQALVAQRLRQRASP